MLAPCPEWSRLEVQFVQGQPVHAGLIAVAERPEAPSWTRVRCEMTFGIAALQESRPWPCLRRSTCDSFAGQVIAELQRMSVVSALSEGRKRCRQKAGSSSTWDLMSGQEAAAPVQAQSWNLGLGYVSASRSGGQDHMLL